MDDESARESFLQKEYTEVVVVVGGGSTPYTTHPLPGAKVRAKGEFSRISIRFFFFIFEIFLFVFTQNEQDGCTRKENRVYESAAAAVPPPMGISRLRTTRARYFARSTGLSYPSYSLTIFLRVRLGAAISVTGRLDALITVLLITVEHGFICNNYIFLL